MNDHADLEPVTDYFQVAALYLSKIAPAQIAFRNGRVWFYFPKDEATPVLNAYETGQLKGPLRDYAASLTRVKTKIFSVERTQDLE